MYLQGLEEHTQLQNAVQRSGRLAARSGRARLLRLGDGRQLAYSEFGAPQGFPIIYLHNQAGSRLEGLFFDEGALAAGFRLIAVDRPGLGQSDCADKGAPPEAFSDDVVELADQLQLARFGLMSWGGGAAFAFSISHRCPERVCFQFSLGCQPVPTLPGGRARAALQRLTLALLRSAVRLRCHVSARLHGPDYFLARLHQRMGYADRKALEDPAVQTLLDRDIRESLRQGYRGVARDTSLGFCQWDFRLSDITVPVHLWQGAADSLAPLSYGQWLARQLPDAVLHRVPGRGHFFFVPDAQPVFMAARRYLSASEIPVLNPSLAAAGLPWRAAV